MSLVISFSPNVQEFWFVNLPLVWDRKFLHTLVRMVPFILSIRILPLGGYVRMAGWGEDTTEIKTGSPASLTIGSDGR